MTFQVTTTKKKNYSILCPNGDMKVQNIDLVSDILWGEINKSEEHIIVDFKNVPYVDSTGIGLLVKILSFLKKEKRKLIFYRIKPMLRDVLDKSGLSRYFSFINTEEELEKILK